MKKRHLFLAVLFSFLILSVHAQTVYIDDDMEYEPGEPLEDWWVCNLPVSNCILIVTGQAHSGTRMGEIPGDGITDAILDLGNKIFGYWSVEFWMYVPAGKEAYWNLQGEVPVTAGEWIVGNFFFNQDGANPGVGSIDDTALGIVNFGFPHDQWFHVAMNFDITAGLPNSTWQMCVNGDEVIPNDTPLTNNAGTYPTSVGGIDFYSINGNNLYYLDDFTYYSNFEIGCILGVEDLNESKFSVFPNPAIDFLSVENSTSTEIRAIQLFDVSGKQVLTKHSNFDQIDVSVLKSGIYFLVIETVDGRVIKKFVKSDRQ